MPEDTARRLAEIREAFDCSVADYGMDPGDTGFLLDIIDALTAERDALLEVSACGECGGRLLLTCVDCGTRHGPALVEAIEPHLFDQDQLEEGT